LAPGGLKNKVRRRPFLERLLTLMIIPGAPTGLLLEPFLFELVYDAREIGGTRSVLNM
jgi:hypothetical protein